MDTELGVWYKRLGYEELFGKSVVVTIEPRPSYCDRGRWIAKSFTRGLFIDDQDGWPRYYFDLDRAKAEIDAWMKFNEQYIVG